LPGTIVFKVIENPTTSDNLLLTGGLNIATVSGVDLHRAGSDTSLFRTTALLPGNDVLLFDQAPGLPGTDPLVRKALALLVDIKAYNKAVSFGADRAATTVYTPNMECYTPADGKFAAGYDTSQALKILQQDGYVKGSDGKLAKAGKPLSIRVIGYKAQNSGPEYLQAVFTQAGITATVTNTDLQTWVNAFQSNNWDVVDDPIGGPAPSPDNIALQLTGDPQPKGGNWMRANDAQYNTLVQKASSASPAQTCAYWRKAEITLFQHVDVKPLMSEVTYWFGAGNVKFSIYLGSLVDPFSIRAG
jgi:peptide/nickel transport system substrate-binding protein